MSSLNTGPASFLPTDTIVDIATCRVRASRQVYLDARRLFRQAYSRAMSPVISTDFEGTMILPGVTDVIRKRLGIYYHPDETWH